MTLRDDALKLHLENHGKLAVVSKVPIKTREDLALAYTRNSVFLLWKYKSPFACLR